MDRRTLGKLFSLGLSLAEAGCAVEPAPAPGSASPEIGGEAEPPRSTGTAASASATALATTTNAARPEVNAAPAAPRNDAEALLDGFAKVDLTYPARLDDVSELVGYVFRRDGVVVCDPSPCAKEWSTLLPSTADHAIVRKGGKLLAVSKATFVRELGAIGTPAKAAARLRLERVLASCRAVGNDDVACTATNVPVALAVSSLEGFVFAVHAPENHCPYGWPVPGTGPAGIGARFVRVGAEGALEAASYPLAERLSLAQRTRHKPVCRHRVVKGRAYRGFSDREEGPSLRAWHARAARQEAAAVVAFERLAEELEGFGAPASLVARARCAADDERRHAAFFGRESQAGAAAAVPAPHAPLDPCDRTPRSLEAVLVENAVEGCAHETFAAVIATHQASHAPSARLRNALATIACEERDHAALAFEIHRWGCSVLSRAASRRVEAARLRATRALLLDPPSVDDIGRHQGEPDPALAARAFAHVSAGLRTATRISAFVG